MLEARLVVRPDGLPALDNFEIVEVTLPDPVGNLKDLTHYINTRGDA